jgi:hypothetical protein
MAKTMLSRAAMREFTQALLDNTEVNADVRKNIIEQLSFLAAEILKKDKQQTTVARAVFDNLAKTIPAVTGVIDLWQKLKPILESYIFS